MRTCCLLLILAGCAANPGETPTTAAPVPVAVEAIRTLPAGTRLRLRPCQIVTAGRFETRVFDGLLRETLRQSPHFDIAAGFEDCPSEHELSIAVDPTAARATVSLHRGKAPPLPVTSAELDGTALTTVVDRLALQIRGRLGETVTVMPRPCALIYSADPSCVRGTERALAEIHRASFALPRLEDARRRDAGCTLTQTAMLGLQLRTGGDPATIARTAAKTLDLLAARVSTTTQHRLMRLVWLARARDGDPRQADRKLLELGEVAHRERPHDPHPIYSQALALNYLGDFERSRPLLTDLRERWPRHAWVAYHLCFAELGTENPSAALETINQADLPAGPTIIPRALAMFHSGQHQQLADLLAKLAESAEVRASVDGEHHLLRMRAALAILTNQRETARDHLLADLDWLRQRPSGLATRAFELVETGEVLILLGYGNELSPRLDALMEYAAIAPTLANGLTYLAGLALIHESRTAPTAALRELRSDNRTAWTNQLEAALHRVRGELIDETSKLSTAIRATDSALVRANLARALRTVGRGDDADNLLADLRQRLLRIDLRRPLHHPLLSPAEALAFLATRP